MSVKEFAARAEISLSLAYALIAERRVPGVKRIGARGHKGKIIVSEEGLVKFLEQCELRPETPAYYR